MIKDERLHKTIPHTVFAHSLPSKLFNYILYNVYSPLISSQFSSQLNFLSPWGSSSFLNRSNLAVKAPRRTQGRPPGCNHLDFPTEGSVALYCSAQKARPDPPACFADINTEQKQDILLVTPHTFLFMRSCTPPVCKQVFSDCHHTLIIRIGNSLTGFVFAISHLWVGQHCCCPGCHTGPTWSRLVFGQGCPKYWGGGLQIRERSGLCVNSGWADSWSQRAEGGGAGTYVPAVLQSYRGWHLFRRKTADHHQILCLNRNAPC